MDVLQLIGQTVPAAVLAAVLFAVMWPAWTRQADRQAQAIERQAECIEKQNEDMRQLIANNTEAITRMALATEHMTEARQAHDERVTHIEQIALHNKEKLIRMDKTIDTLPDILRGISGTRH